MLGKMYPIILKAFKPPSEKDDPSSGPLSGKVRRGALEELRRVDGRFLDIGCGEGLLLAELLSINPEVKAYGLDSDLGQVDRCGDRMEEMGVWASLTVGDASSLPYPDSFFDCASAVNIFYNLTEDVMRAILRDAHRVLKPGGILVTDYRNGDNPFIKFRYWAAPYYDEGFRSGEKKLNAYKCKKIERIISGAGFTVHKMHKIGRPIASAYLLVLKKN